MNKLIIIKSIVWNDNEYKKPSEYKSTSGFTVEYGFGHEEWNNNSNGYWRGYKLFHTEHKEKLLNYSKDGNLGILIISQKNNQQYLLGVAANIYNNTEEEMDIIAKEISLYDNWKDVWSLNKVKKLYNNEPIAKLIA